jgi:HK97 family phage major capsid protein
LDPVRHWFSGLWAVVSTLGFVLAAGMFEMSAVDQYATVEELQARATEIKSRLGELDGEFAGKDFPAEVRTEWNQLNTEFDAIGERIKHLNARSARLAQIADSQPEPIENRYGFSAPRVPDSMQGDIFDPSTVRVGADNLDEMDRQLRDRAMKAIEIGKYGAPNTRKGEPSKEDRQAAAERVLIQTPDPDKILARQFLATGSPVYERAFWKHLASQPLTSDEARAMAIGTGSAGGFLLPFTLDPTIILTSNGVVNPMRQISRVEPVTQNEWRGVTGSEGTASYVAEAAEAADNSTALGQPIVQAKRAQYFVPFSIELDQDWNALRTEVGRLVQQAKDNLEATKFLSGVGSTEPQGLHNGATAVFSGPLNLANVYETSDALPPRFQAVGRWVSHRTIQSRIRQLDTAGGGGFWANLREGYRDDLIGYPIDQYSTMTSGTAVGGTVLTIGDFQHYLIVDRVGMSADVIPHLFGTANNFPTGQRGFYSLWRNSGTVLAWQAFRSLKLT